MLTISAVIWIMGWTAQQWILLHAIWHNLWLQVVHFGL